MGGKFWYRSASLLALAVAVSPAHAQVGVPIEIIGPRNEQPGKPPPNQDDISGTPLSLPAVVEGQPALEVIVVADGMAIVAVDAQSLARTLEGRLEPTLASALASRIGLITVPELLAQGVTVQLNPNSLVVEILLATDARSAQEVAFQSEYSNTAAVPLPASSFAVGVTGALRYLRSFGDFDLELADLDLTGFANVGGPRGVYALYGGTFRLKGQGRAFERDRLILFHDDVDAALRYSAGDLAPLLPRQLGDIQLAGVSLERNYQEIQPLRNVRPTGQRTFRVERPSRVEIYSNGALLRTLDVQAGMVDLRSIPAISSTSNITIVVEDSFGRREIDAFTLTSELELLAAGFSEFNISAGVLRDDNFGGFTYGDEPVATGFYRRGLSESLTLGSHFAATSDVQNIGADLATIVLNGLVALSATGSNADGGLGGALLVEYRGDPLRLTERNGQLNVQMEARTREFATPDSFLLSDSIKLDFAAEYRLDINDRLGFSAGGSWFERYGTRGANKSVFAGLQFSFGRAFLTATGRYARRADGVDDSGVLFTLSLPLGRSHLLSASGDTGSERARVEFRKRRDFRVPEFDYSGFVQTSPFGEEAGGRLRFANSRFELEGNATRTFGSRSDGTLLAVRGQGGLAFADGVFAIGRDPGRGFAIVRRGASLDGAPVDVYGQGSNRRVAQANGMGPAVVPQVSPYRPDEIRAAVLGDNPFLDIGPGEYLTQVGAATGHVISIDNVAVASASVTFVTSEGLPVSAKFGTLSRDDGSESQSIFTTREGRSFITNLRSGRYVVSLSDGQYTGAFDVTVEGRSAADLGTVTLQER